MKRVDLRRRLEEAEAAVGARWLDSVLDALGTAMKSDRATGGAIAERLGRLDIDAPCPTPSDVALVLLRAVREVAPAIADDIAGRFDIDLGEVGQFPPSLQR
jgi:hypothetical protein